ncbi:MAG: SUMF1/EgtB/PvdO family nonheme iron enzyme [Treponema sp.]|jgi:hypothetical protein|nr:SUMF1/EgtB/PvdO family nonheme iron enzyme [Treponema sp.]
MSVKKPIAAPENKQSGGEADDRVTLPALFGIRPGQYLAVLYGLILLIILFFVVCYPGLAHPGTVIAFRSEPAGAAVRIDGLTQGRTPCEIAVPKGKRRVEMALPGFQPFTLETEVKGRLLGSLFFPRRASVTGTLQADGPVEALREGAARYAAWSFAGEPTAAYQVPLELSEGAYRSGPQTAADQAAMETAEGILDASLRFAVTKAALRDFVRAKLLTENGGLAPSPLTLLDSAGDMLNRLSRTPGAASWLADLLPPEAAGTLRASAWYQSNAAPLAEPAPSGPPAGVSPEVLDLGGLRFWGIPGGSFSMGDPGARTREIHPFWIAEAEVSPAAWADFIEANPAWNRENRARLEEQGLVSEDYLGEFPPAPDGGIAGVSWYAAEAYCRWLTGLLPGYMAGYEARLPLEAEWEYAAKLAGQPDAPPVEGFLGGRWEWCADPFVPLPFFPAGDRYVRMVSSPERSLRGGAWINQAGSVKAETRASLPPDTCSAFVSLRPVIALREAP